MKASGKAVDGQTATLQFSHQTARLRFYLTDSDSDNAPVTGAMVTAIIDGQTYTAHEDGNGYYSLLVAPGKLVYSDADFVSITTSEKTYKATAPAKATFTAGKSYNYTFALKCPPYLTFTADAEQGFVMTIGSNFTGGTFEYSVGDGEWTAVTSGITVTFGGDNGTLRLRGVSADGTATGTFPHSQYCSISFTNNNVSVDASGDIRTLVDYKNYNTAETESAKFCWLFQNCTALTSAPKLPATTLAKSCYYSMFDGCTGLTTAPELPATTLAEGCYDWMFGGCTRFTTAPELPATTLAEDCYSNMFNGCTSLTTVTIKAENYASGALDNWLKGCSKN